MDPNATYDEMYDLTNRALSGCEVDVIRLAELVEALDRWIRDGGFPPGAWSAAL